MTGIETWGDDEDILIYSYLTKIRVKTVQNSGNGFICVQDTLKEINILKDVDWWQPLAEEAITEHSPVLLLLHHQ